MIFYHPKALYKVDIFHKFRHFLIFKMIYYNNKENIIFHRLEILKMVHNNDTDH